MITNRQAYEQRHARLCQKAEQRLRERLEEEPNLPIAEVVFEYARETRRAIARRDNIAAVYAVMAAHVAIKQWSGDTMVILPEVRSPESTAPSPAGA